MSTRIAFTVTGKVQGVCYRAFTVDAASEIGLTGYVRNAADGSVQGEAQGDSGSLSRFVKQLKSGPSAARVEDVKTKDLQTKGDESGFKQKS